MNNRRVFITILLFTRFSVALCRSFDWHLASFEWKEKLGKEEKPRRADWKLLLGCATVAEYYPAVKEKGRAAADQVFRECVRKGKKEEEHVEKELLRWHNPYRPLWETWPLLWQSRWKEEEERLEWQIFLGCASLGWKDENAQRFEPCVKRAKMEAEQEFLHCLQYREVEFCMVSFEMPFEEHRYKL